MQNDNNQPLTEDKIMNNSNATMAWIKNKFKNENPLTLEEEQALFEEIKKGNMNAKAKMLHANMKFVIQVAAQYRNDTLTPEELVNEGAIGLWRALEAFDPSRGVRFITYAVWWVKACIARAISEKGSLVRLPLNQQTKLHKGVRACKDVKDLDEELKTLNSISGRATSINTPLNDDGKLTLEDVIEDTEAESADKAVEDQFRTNYTHKLLNRLPSRERQALEHLHGIGTNEKSVRETSVIMGVSRERVRQLRDQAMVRLRNLNYDGHMDDTIRELCS